MLYNVVHFKNRYFNSANALTFSIPAASQCVGAYNNKAYMIKIDFNYDRALIPDYLI